MAETPVMTGADVPVELTDTLSKVAVDIVPVPALSATNPTYAFAAILIV